MKQGRAPVLSVVIRWTALVLCLLTLSGCFLFRKDRPPPRPVAMEPEVPAGKWILVDTRKDHLLLMRGNKILKRFDHVALGSAGAGIKRRKGDSITPRGKFTLGWVNRASKFDVFLGLNYPNLEYAKRGLAAGTITRSEYNRIASALSRGERPPQDTALGGYLGIHGVGRGDPEIHKYVNWTDGCVAVTNHQIKQLLAEIERGMVVEIR